jgi:hypothetical protein
MPELYGPDNIVWMLPILSFYYGGITPSVHHGGITPFVHHMQLLQET